MKGSQMMLTKKIGGKSPFRREDSKQHGNVICPMSQGQVEEAGRDTNTF